MAFFYSSYFGLGRVNNSGPETKGWIVTDKNWETTSLLFKNAELHRHNAATPITYPGYNYATPTSPATPIITTSSSGGYLAPGVTVGVRLAYVNTLGLETQACPEIDTTIGTAPTRPDSPQAGDPQLVAGNTAVPGGTYIYGVTKSRAGAETQISNVTTVNVPFDPAANSYSVPLTFDNINGYTDGTDALRIYRAAGQNSSFVLLQTITDGNTTTYTDNNSIEDATISPPTINLFGRTNSLGIDWSGLATPTGVSRMRVYITQQPGVWGTNHLLTDRDMTVLSTPSVSYVGSETLAAGFPYESTQIPANPAKINLRTEATGAFTLTDEPDFQGFGAKYFVFATGLNKATPVDGSAYVETSTATPQFRVRLGGNYQTLVAAGASYAHANVEPGGHNAANILYPTSGGANVKSVLDIIATPVANFRKPVTSLYKAPVGGAPLTISSTAATPIGDMDTGAMSIAVQGQLTEVTFNGDFLGTVAGQTVTLQFEIDGSLAQGAETIRSFTLATPNAYTTATVYFATPASLSTTRVKVYWKTSTGTVTSYRRTLVGKVNL